MHTGFFVGKKVRRSTLKSGIGAGHHKKRYTAIENLSKNCGRVSFVSWLAVLQDRSLDRGPFSLLLFPVLLHFYVTGPHGFHEIQGGPIYVTGPPNKYPF